jgi:hypothetical protein
VARAGDHGTTADLVGEEEAVTEAIHAAAHPGRKSAETGEAGDAADADSAESESADDAAADAAEGAPA